MADFVEEMFAPQTGEETPPASAAEPPVEQPAEAPAPEPAAEPAPEPQPEPVAPVEDKSVPLKTFLDMRDEARELKRWKAEREAQERQQQSQPNPRDDPEAFAAFQQGEVGKALFVERFATSEYLAKEKFGEDKVNDAAVWAEAKANSDPTFAAQFAAERFPMIWIVQQHQRDALLSDIGDPSKLDDWFAREAAKRGYAMPNAAPAVALAPAPAAAAQPVARPAAPPRSLAAEPGNGSSASTVTAAGDFAALNAIFDKRA